MLLKIRHALLEVNNHPTNKQSAIIINNEFILSTANLLWPYIRTISLEAKDSCASSKIIHALQQCMLINAQEQTDEAKLLNSLSYQVTYDNHKQKTPILVKQRAHMLYLFNSAEISRQLHALLRCPTANLTTDNAQNPVLLSSFLVLSMRSASVSTNRLKHILTELKHYAKLMQPLNVLDDVLAMVTPFGNENFFKCSSIGKISNVLGRNSTIFLISNPLPTGCEGGAVFNKNLHLIGVIICTSFKREMQNVQLTMVANFRYIINDFMQQMNFPVHAKTWTPKTTAHNSWERAMVVIHVNGKQSSGTFVKIHKRKFILTCAHALACCQTTEKEKVYCRNVDGEFEAAVLWYNPEYNKPFDLALLTAPADLPDDYCAGLSVSKPHTGQRIYNAGFPCLLNFNLKYDFQPSIFQGRVLKYGPGSIITDSCVQMGQSGGPMFDQRGGVLGICIANMFMDDAIYPHVNTAVPVYEIRTALENYAKSNDISFLDKLIADDPKAWSPTVMALSKI